MRNLIVLGGVIGAAACGPVTGPGDVQRVEGAFCEKGKADEAVQETDSWRVTIYYNESLVKGVIEDGVYRNVEYRSCASMTCRIDPNFASTAEAATTACRQATNITPPYIG